MSIDCNSLDSFQLQDWGRSTGMDGTYTTNPGTSPTFAQQDIFTQYAGNVGPMVRDIKMSNNSINGLVVRPGTMDTEGVWDDADIVYVVEGPIVVPNVTIYGGLKVESNSEESLVVKFLTPAAAQGTSLRRRSWPRAPPRKSRAASAARSRSSATRSTRW